MRVYGEGGGNNPEKSLLFVRCHQHCSNKWQYLHTVYLFICFASGLNLYDGQLFIHVQFHVHIMKLAYVCT